MWTIPALWIRSFSDEARSAAAPAAVVVVAASHVLADAKRAAPIVHHLLRAFARLDFLFIRVARRLRNVRSERRLVLADHAIAVAQRQDRIDGFLRVEQG